MKKHSPKTVTNEVQLNKYGWVAKRLNAADCKSAP